MEETDRKNDCIARDSGIGRRRERDKRDADIKLEARQIKREGKKLEQRRAGKKKQEAGGEGDTATMVIKVLGDAIYYKQNIYRRWLFADEYAFRNMVMEHSTEIAACPEMRPTTLLYRATLSLPQTLH